MKMPKYLGQQVQLTVVLVDEDTLNLAIEVGGYAEDRTFIGKSRIVSRPVRMLLKLYLRLVKADGKICQMS